MFIKIDYWEDRYANPEVPSEWYIEPSQLCQKLLEYISPSSSILELGCGTSGFTYVF